VLELRPTPFDHPDAVRLIGEIQQVYRERYGNADATPVEPVEFAAPYGYFVVGYVDGTAVACGGWRARNGGTDPGLHDGDAEIKRMYVAVAHRGRGFARVVLAELERTAAAAGRRRAVLETGVRQPEAIALYTSAGYVPVTKFGVSRDKAGCRCFAKPLTRLVGRESVQLPTVLFAPVGQCGRR